MAAGVGESCTSQFFITLKPSPEHDGKYAPFGRICEGMAVVERIGLVKTNEEGKPLSEIKILRTECLDEEGARVGGSDDGAGGNSLRLTN